MNPDEIWKDVTKWLSKERVVQLPRGKEFNAHFNKEKSLIEVVPSKTGVPRIVSYKEWIRFAEKFNVVKSNGYDPWKPGHYAMISYNSSYIVAILRQCGYSE